MRCLCFQLCQNHRTIMLRMPGSPNSKVRSLAIKILRISLPSEDFFFPQTCVQPQHHKHIRRQAVNGIRQLIHLLIRKWKTILLRNPAHILLQINGRILSNDRRRSLVVLAGLPTVRFDFFSALCSLIGAKKYPVGFPTRHQRL